MTTDGRKEKEERGRRRIRSQQLRMHDQLVVTVAVLRRITRQRRAQRTRSGGGAMMIGTAHHSGKAQRCRVRMNKRAIMLEGRHLSPPIARRMEVKRGVVGGMLAIETVSWEEAVMIAPQMIVDGGAQTTNTYRRASTPTPRVTPVRGALVVRPGMCRWAGVQVVQVVQVVPVVG